MTGDGAEDELRDLLIGAVPDLADPGGRLDRVARRVRRRRRQRAVAGLGGTLVVLGLLTWAAGGLDGSRGPLLRQLEPPAAGRTTPAAPASTAAASAPTSSSPSALSSPSPSSQLYPSSPLPAPSPFLPPPPPASSPSSAPRAGSSAQAGTANRRTPGPPAVAYDVSKVPAGSPGSALRRIRPAQDKPTASDGTGIFRTVCLYSHMGVDAPGGPSASPTAALRTYWGRTPSGRSTCRGGVVDRSVYGTPSIIDTRSGTPIAPEVVDVYFSSGYAGIAPTDVRVPPTGLAVAAGNPSSTGGQVHAGWRCLGSGATTASPAPCPGGRIELQVTFPQCWDGRNLTAPDGRSHMAYPANGRCPASHPVALPEVSFHLVYVSPGSGVAGWRLSTDMPGRPPGTSLQAWWINGWDPSVSTTWTNGCVRAAVSCGSHLLGDGTQLDGDA